MDLNAHDHDNEIVEPGELLEDSWFFGNLLQTKSRMLRSFSDPCSSSNYERTYESIDKLPATKGSDSDQRRRSSRKTTSFNSLVRAPSLPTSLESPEMQDEEIEFSMGKLIRQASLNYSHTLPPRTHPPKGLTPSPSMSRHKSRKSPVTETSKFESPINQLKTQKSLKDLEFEELQGFKDLGFEFDKKDLSPNVINIIPGLQENEEKTTARPYLSEAWAAQSSAPPVPRWGGKRSTEDMKAQIKFWARAVASNVRQEC